MPNGRLGKIPTESQKAGKENAWAQMPSRCKRLETEISIFKNIFHVTIRAWKNPTEKESPPK